MTRYLELYFHMLKFSIQKSLQFRIDFFFRVVMDCVFYAVHFAFFGVIMNHSALLGGWTAFHLQVLVAAICLVDALNMTFFSNNMWIFPGLVNKGDLDIYLVKPVSTRFFVSLRDFALNSFVNLLVAIGLSVFILLKSPQPLSFVSVVCFYLAVIFGTLIFHFLHFSVVCLVFWTQSAAGISNLSFTLVKLSEYPDSMYPRWLRRMVIFVLPYALVSAFPARVLFSGSPVHYLGCVVLGATCVFVVSQIIWRAGLRAYGSASS
jgi:ABC-2 type transport system permease protein